ncbi:hypothetical protein B4098_0542 [Heyndrickxia coagulans]|uniref:Uncharacterized protein n=1 Tax=Heyndrickxia coagulans TaxID=1398 RepID=A0A150K6M1_HEYCO|nr:hypothetical protein B4098_0542 [Heyndrickxia coagulans]KYC67326.1 hypothetical protein B4100_0557 [Heyndrickxia coagulans]KYC70534.1 hypothetical protein B4099_0648 [Heyndrickxia coagulans]
MVLFTILYNFRHFVRENIFAVKRISGMNEKHVAHLQKN